MANSNLTKIKKAFSTLDEKAQLALIKDVYNFSKEMKTFLEGESEISIKTKVNHIVNLMF